MYVVMRTILCEVLGLDPYFLFLRKQQIVITFYSIFTPIFCIMHKSIFNDLGGLVWHGMG